ncbi:hypothetical protein I302_101256 [Kwoniella bestiolae CBS 10118]|uniref:Uncharacterized protein n=1 Tax=Kwoniella bestiolae CBS 10118 TaxID=1296100 RepID=A0A1B9G7C8_9TREE|nr:hypothetical protein I302_04628 [Kwoniella bestiolae CBS 10118]OCF26937.1 hypothetical protein I302_04628 [Kwoniella bestiolae CBS 10118]
MSTPVPPHPPNYSSSSHTKSIPVPPAPAPAPASTSTNGPESMKLQLNIQSLSLDCSIPLGSNLGLQVAVPPAPGSQPTQNNTSPPQQPASSTSHPPPGSNQLQSNSTFGPESILLGLATGFVQRLEKVERDLEEERRINVGHRSTIERLETRLNRLELSVRPGETSTADQKIDTQLPPSFATSQIPQNREYQLNPPTQISIPTALPARTTPQSYTVKQEIEPEEVDHDTWDQRQPQLGREEEFDDVPDDPTGLGLDDDQAVLYGYKPRQTD